MARRYWQDYKRGKRALRLREMKMARTKSFKELVQHHVKRDAKFAEALLREGVDAMLSGDVETGKTILRDYIKATVGFEKLGAATGAPPKSLIRMFGPRGNPQAKNLFSVIGYLQKQAGVHLHVARGWRTLAFLVRGIPLKVPSLENGPINPSQRQEGRRSLAISAVGRSISLAPVGTAGEWVRARTHIYHMLGLRRWP